MKTWQWMMVLATTGTLAAACSVKTTEVDDDSSSTSSTTATTATGPTTNATTVTATTATGPTSSSTGSTACDTGTPGDLNAQVCTDCFNCAATNECATETQACVNDTSCQDYDTCRIGCIETCDTDMNGLEGSTEETCFDDCHGDPEGTPSGTSCLGMYGTGADLWLNWLSCNVCVACPTNCNATMYCTSGM